MRLTKSLFAQHLGWMFKKHWQIQGKRVPTNLQAREELEKLGVPVVEAKDVAFPKEPFQFVKFNDPHKIVEDETHPDWNSTPCHIYGNDNVLLDGINQAQVLLKTIIIEGLPRNLEESIDKIQTSNAIEKNVKNSILASHVFDAQQEKLAIVKDPTRPAYVLPRVYGITDHRRCHLLLTKLLFECEKIAGRHVNMQRKIFNDVEFVTSYEKDGDRIQLNVAAETLMTSNKPLNQVKGRYDGEIPDLSPVKYTASIPKRNIYKFRNLYPLRGNLSISNPHTVFLHYSPSDVKNLHETPVTQDQFESRTMLKGFAAAASRAQQIYGENATNLSQPIVVQSVQTDGKQFHFGVFQLNTLDLNGSDGLKNYWFHIPSMELFSECGYKTGRPILDGYNKEVFRHFNAFYNNC